MTYNNPPLVTCEALKKTTKKVGLLPDRDKNGEDLVRSGFLDASTFLEHAEMWLQPESYSKFYRFYQLQVRNFIFFPHFESF